MEKNKGKIFSIKFLPMDLGRIVSSVSLLLFPIKKIYMSEKSRRFSGGAIVAANHTSFRDPFLVGGVFWYRRTFFLAAEVVMKNKLVAFLLKLMGCIKIDRTIYDLNAIKKTIDILKDERIVTIFPQGGIQQGSDLALKSGIALMALKSQKPIIPVYLSSQGLFRRGYAVIGNPIYLESESVNPSVSDIYNITQTIHSGMEECRIFLQNIKGEKSDGNI